MRNRAYLLLDADGELQKVAGCGKQNEKLGEILDRAGKNVMLEWQHCYQWRTEGGVWGVQTPPKFRRYRWSPRSHKQEEPASRFPFIVHCVLIWCNLLNKGFF